MGADSRTHGCITHPQRPGPHVPKRGAGGGVGQLQGRGGREGPGLERAGRRRRGGRGSQGAAEWGSRAQHLGLGRAPGERGVSPRGPHDPPAMSARPACPSSPRWGFSSPGKHTGYGGGGGSSSHGETGRHRF